MKKIFLLIISIMLVSVAQSSLAAPTNLVVNGGFEQPVVGAPQLWDIYSSGYSGLGWTIEWRSDIPANYGNLVRPNPALQELQRGVNGWLPQEGAQYAELDTDWDGPTGSVNGEPASVLIYQDISTKCNCKYELKFYFSPRPGTPAEDNTLEISWGGNVIDTISQSGGSQTSWTEYTYTLNAAGSVTRLQFTDLGTANSLGTFLDNVSVIKTSCERIRLNCCGDIEVENDNFSKINNTVITVAGTGNNTVSGGNGGEGGDVTGAGIGGNGGDGTGGMVITGNAGSISRVINVSNINITRIRR